MKTKHSFFKKYFPFALIIIIFVVILIGLFGLFIARTQNFAIRSQHAKITAHLLEGLTPEEFHLVVGQLKKAQKNVSLMKMNTWVLDSEGRVLYSSQNDKYPYDWEKTPKPIIPYEFITIKDHSTLLSSVNAANFFFEGT